MVKRSLICTMALIALYSIYLHFFNTGYVVQYTLQNNLIRAEDYLYNDSVKGSDLVIGTSISAKINQDKLPKNVYLLAGAGFSVYDGMAFIKNSNTHPKYIFLEENSILLGDRPDFVKFLFNAPDYYRKKYLVSMRDGYQPAGEFYKAVSIHTAPRIQWFSNYIFNPLVGIFCKGKEVSADTKDYYADAKMSTTADTAMIKAGFVRLKKSVAEMEKMGIKVCFYRVPNDRVVYNSFVSKKIRDYFPEYFPPSAYAYLPDPDINEYHTTDQIHMDDTSCTKFTRFMANGITALKKNNAGR